MRTTKKTILTTAGVMALGEVELTRRSWPASSAWTRPR